MESDYFNVGDVVEWTSHAGGKVKTKTGKVIAVIPANTPAMRFTAPIQAARTHRDKTISTASRNQSRDHQSYLIEVKGPKKPFLYYPLVQKLRRVSVPEAQAPKPAEPAATTPPEPAQV